MTTTAPSALIVEDDASLRLLARVNLELDGFVVSEASSLQEAEAELARETPDVVLLDVHLGGGDSYELLANLRARGIPVVIVTGSAEVGELLAAADAVIAKPFSPEDLVGTARRLARVKS